VARMASTMRTLSTSEIIASPASRGAAAAERATAAGEAASSRPGGARRPPRTRNRDKDRSPCASPWSCAALRVSAALPGDAAHDHEENEQEEHEGEDIDEAGLVVWPLLGARLPFLGVDRYRLNNIVHPATDAADEIVGPEARDDGVLYDELRYRVGKR